MRESEIEKYLVKRVQAMGGEVRKAAWVGRRGAPDRLVLLPARETSEGWAVEGWELPQTIWVELKAPGERAKPHQLREHARLRKMGQTVVVVDSLEGVDEVLQ